ncbi:hypothetical protein BDV33DRAFT_195696 [Aspergillus novoparasiticus]|uniref:Uncharacterized protein n=1 Tax=Aspergillus novoparasiticus TaxID=986946 RepID=A0A5N6ECZ3_9EURO|nr:hypothetical protein BDV33DRAFT_195696 [Aspergillus novoparasiticus]
MYPGEPDHTTRADVESSEFVVVYPPIIDDIHSVLDPVQIWIYPLVECVTRKLCQWLQPESHVIPQGGAMSIVSLSVSLFY